MLPAKKDANENYTDTQMCGDYRALNVKTKPDRYAILDPEDIFDLMEGCKYFSVMDMRMYLRGQRSAVLGAHVVR